jgi:hypothetical protein
MPTPKVNSWLGWQIFTVNKDGSMRGGGERLRAGGQPGAAATGRGGVVGVGVGGTRDDGGVGEGDAAATGNWLGLGTTADFSGGNVDGPREKNKKPGGVAEGVAGRRGSGGWMGTEYY